MRRPHVEKSARDRERAVQLQKEARRLVDKARNTAQVSVNRRAVITIDRQAKKKRA